MGSHKIFAVNPGSTSTKIALFQDDTCLYSKNVSHDAEELAKYESLSQQLPYRRDTILDLLDKAGVSLEDVEVFVGLYSGLSFHPFDSVNVILYIDNPVSGCGQFHFHLFPCGDD